MRLLILPDIYLLTALSLLSLVTGQQGRITIQWICTLQSALIDGLAPMWESSEIDVYRFMNLSVQVLFLHSYSCLSSTFAKSILWQTTDRATQTCADLRAILRGTTKSLTRATWLQWVVRTIPLQAFLCPDDARLRHLAHICAIYYVLGLVYSFVDGQYARYRYQHAKLILQI